MGRLAIEKLRPDFVGVTELLEEACVFGDSFDAKGLVLASNGVYEIIVGNGDGTGSATDIARVWVVSLAQIRVGFTRLGR
jgi:hypothetical protein